MECELLQTVDFPNHDVFVGKVVATYCDPSVLTGGEVDLEKLQPILFAVNDRSYWGIGKKLAKAWSVGKDSKNIFSFCATFFRRQAFTDMGAVNVFFAFSCKNLRLSPKP
jgi:hypothetical protein